MRPADDDLGRAGDELRRRSLEALVRPCPCCAGEPLKRTHPLRRTGRVAAVESRPALERLAGEHAGGWRVLCYGCGLQLRPGWYPTAEDALQAWNSRGGVVWHYPGITRGGIEAPPAPVIPPRRRAAPPGPPRSPSPPAARAGAGASLRT